MARIKADKDAEWKVAKAASVERNKPVPFTRIQLDAAKAVRTRSGWHRVAKVNAKSVAVETGYSWTDRYPIDKILEVRA